MNFNDFFLEADEKSISLNFENIDPAVTHRIGNEALFHLPLIAMTILLLSSSRAKPKSTELGQLIGECFERTFTGFKGSSQHLGWSANLRMRTVKALTFLEMTNLVVVGAENLKISINPIGKKLLQKAISEDTNLSYTLQILRRSYKDIKVEKQISLELS